MAFRSHSIVVLAATAAFILAGCVAKEGVLTASWTPPTTNADGSPLTELTSYRIYFGTAGPPCPNGRFITIAATGVGGASDQRVTMRLTNLIEGQVYYVAVTAVNSRGVSSRCSNTARAPARRPD
jgi:hypothetical protein